MGFWYGIDFFGDVGVDVVGCVVLIGYVGQPLLTSQIVEWGSPLCSLLVGRRLVDCDRAYLYLLWLEVQPFSF